MSAKQQLAEAIQELPDSLTAQEVVDRLYRLFKLRRPSPPEETQRGTAQEAADIADRLRRRFPNGEVKGAPERFWQEMRAERSF
jgi:hypothetical protein